MSWYSGSHVTPTSSPVSSNASPKARMLASRLACDSATPFGDPVLPDVYWIRASASPLATIPESEFDSGIDRRSRSAGTVATVVRLGASGRSSDRGPLGFGEGEQDAGAGVAQDRRLARGVLLDLIGAERRVERHRHAAREQDAEVGVEERRLGAEQQRHPLARDDAAAAQSGGHRRRVAIQAAVGDRRLGAVVGPQLDVDAVGALLDLPAQRLHQRPRPDRRSAISAYFPGLSPGLGPGLGPRLGPRRSPGLGPGQGSGAGDRGGDLARRVGLRKHRLAERDAGRLFEAHRQLDALEAAERQLAGQRLVGADRGARPRRIDLGEQLPKRLEDERRGVVEPCVAQPNLAGAHAGPVGAAAASCIARHVSSTWRRSVVGAPIATRTIQRPSRTAAVR